MSSPSDGRRKIGAKISYTYHAKLRWAERGLTLDDIERAVLSPVQTIYDPQYKNYKSFIKVDSQFLVVIHTNPNKPEITIITAYYKDRGGLKKLGFSNI